MEDIEYTTCVPFAVIVADELVEDRQSCLAGERRQAVVHPWVMQEEGEA